MKCLISNCNHNKSNRMRHMQNTCWNLWQICSCCAKILNELQVIQYPNTNNNTGCKNAIAKELSVLPTPDQNLIIKIKLKKKFRNKMSYEGVVM